MSEEATGNVAGTPALGTENAGTGAQNQPAPAAGTQNNGGNAKSQDAGTGNSMLSPNAGGTPKHWIDGYGENVRGLNTLRKFGTVDDALVAYANLEKMASSKGLREPTVSDSDEVKAAFLAQQRFGIQTPSAYSVKAKDMADVGVSEEAFAKISQGCFDIGLSDRATRGVMNILRNFQMYEVQQLDQANRLAFEECGRALKEEFGERAEDVRQGIIKMLQTESPELARDIADNELSNDIRFLRLMNKFVERTQDGGAPKNHGNTIESGDAKAQIQRLMNSPAYKNGNHPGHRAAQMRFLELVQSVKPEDY